MTKSGLKLFGAWLLVFVGLAIKLLLETFGIVTLAGAGGVVFTLAVTAGVYFLAKKLLVEHKFETGTDPVTGESIKFATPKMVYVITAISLIITAASIIW